MDEFGGAACASDPLFPKIKKYAILGNKKYEKKLRLCLTNVDMKMQSRLLHGF
jgi:hypothetical protein